MNRETGSPQLRPYYDDGQHSGEELEPFNFDDDTNYNTQGDFAPIEDEYDAVNDDTFGCAEPIGNTEGLDTLAERTKLLDLGDFGKEKDFAWPDPADIPLPSAFKDPASEFAAWVEGADLRPSTSGFGTNDLFMFGNESKDTSYKFDDDEMYRNLSRHWESKTPTNEFQKNLGNNLLDLFTQKQQNADQQKPTQKAQVLTEEMLLKMAEEDEEKQRQQNVMKALGLLKSPSPIAVAQSGFVSIEPENHQKFQNQQPYAQSPKREESWNQGPPPYFNNRPPNFYQQNQPPPGFGQQPPYHQNRREYQRNMPPPNFQQHLPPNNKQMYNNQMPYPNMTQPPPFNGMNPSVMNLMNMHSNQRYPPGMPRPPFPPHQNFNGFQGPPPPFPSQNMLAYQRASMSNSVRGSNTSLCSSRTKKPFMPSTKTISDFAFDPYAGLMSKKEREWLIKIQLIQCMISGDPIEDDYYYSIWKERNVLAKAPMEWRVQIQPKYYNFDNTYPSERYVPPAFVGSLGRPTHSSTSFPRQIIELHADSLDDDTESTVGGKGVSQKKLRAILLRIENASMTLLECRDYLYKSSKNESADNEKIVSVVSEKIQSVINCVASPNDLPTVMLLQKGRFLIGQLITYSDDNQASEIMATLIQTTSRFAHKIPSDSNSQPLFRSIVSKLRSMDLYTFKILHETLPINSLEPLLEISSFVQQLCFAFIIGLCGREVQIPGPELISGPIGSWLADTDVKRLTTLIPVFNQDAVDFDLLQLNKGLSFFPPQSIGRQLSELLKTRIKQRPS